MSEDSFDLFMSYLSKNAKATQSGKIKLESKLYAPQDHRRFVTNNFELLKEFPDLSDEDFFESVLGEFISLNSPSKQTDYNGLNTPGSPGEYSLSYILDKCIIVNIANSFGEKLVVNKETGKIEPYDLEKVTDILDHKAKAAYKASLTQINRLHEFTPFKPFQGFGDGPKATYNMYQQPDWRYVTDPNPGHPDVIKAMQFIDHLFADKASKREALSWVTYSLQSRCSTYLTAIGHQGIGKGIFTVEIVGGLHGPGNFKRPKNYSTSTFNGYMADTTYLNLDELHCKSKAELEVLKQQIEKIISVESKGVDQRTIENHCSISITCNNVDNFFMLPQESRKFTYVELTQKPLFDFMSEEEVNALVKSLTQPDVLAGLYEAIKRDSGKYNPFKPLHGPTWEHHCSAKAPLGIKMILKAIKESMNDDDLMQDKDKMGVVQYDKVAEAYYKEKPKFSRGGMTSLQDVKNFFDEYTVNGKRIAVVDVDARTIRGL